MLCIKTFSFIPQGECREANILIIIFLLRNVATNQSQITYSHSRCRAIVSRGTLDLLHFLKVLHQYIFSVYYQTTRGDSCGSWVWAETAHCGSSPHCALWTNRS